MTPDEMLERAQEMLDEARKALRSLDHDSIVVSGSAAAIWTAAAELRKGQLEICQRLDALASKEKGEATNDEG